MLAHLREQGFNSSSLRLYRAVLQGFHQWRGGQLVFPVKVPRRQPDYVEPQIIERLLTLAQDSPRDCLILLLMIDAGLRRGEAVNLKVRHVGKDALRFPGKGGRERTIPLTSALNNALKPFCVGKPPSSSVLGVKDKAIYQVVRKYGNLAGRADLHPHDLRHAFAERLVERGASLRDVQELLGHESLDTTQAYIGVTANHLRGAIDLLDDDYKKPEEQDSETEQWDKFTERWHQLMEMVMRDREPSGLSK